MNNHISDHRLVPSLATEPSASYGSERKQGSNDIRPVEAGGAQPSSSSKKEQIYYYEAQHSNAASHGQSARAKPGTSISMRPQA